MMKYKEIDDDVLMVEEEFGSEIIEYDESEDMFLETEFMDYDINDIDSDLNWSDI